MNNLNLLRIEHDRHAARTFVAAKGCLPRDRYELAEWLLEFTAEYWRMYEALHRAYEDHMLTCNRPFLTVGAGDRGKP